MEEKNEKVEPGMVVRVAGVPSPLMLVKAVAERDHGDGNKAQDAFCLWFEGGRLWRETFPVELLLPMKSRISVQAEISTAWDGLDVDE